MENLINTSCGGNAHSILCWNIVQSANAYSQLTGVLASFVFAAIILILSNPPKGRTIQDISLPLYSSLIAFLSLLLSSFLFALLAGEETVIRASLLGVIASVIFSLAILQVILSIIFVFKEYSVEGWVIAGAKFLFYYLMLISLAYIFIALNDVLWVKTSGKTPILWLFIWSALVGVITYVLSFVISNIVRRRMLKLAKTKTKYYIWMLHCSAAFSMSIVVFYGILNTISERFLLELAIDTFLLWYQIAIAVLFIIVLLFLSLYQISLPEQG